MDRKTYVDRYMAFFLERWNHNIKNYLGMEVPPNADVMIAFALSMAETDWEMRQQRFMAEPKITPEPKFGLENSK